jgi:predicted PhzF superfamily epimerase YddE/YHI9
MSLQPAETARFHTLSGLLTATQRDGWIELDFPATPTTLVEPPTGLAAALGARPSYVGMNVFDYLVEIESEATVRSLRPDVTALGRLPVRGVIVTAASAAPEFDFVSRFFAPAVGVNEDPVTGSAHCCLAPFWAGRLGKTEMVAHQASARGGVVRVRLGPGAERVLLGDQAVTVLVGELRAG